MACIGFHGIILVTTGIEHHIPPIMEESCPLLGGYLMGSTNTIIIEKSLSQACTIMQYGIIRRAQIFSCFTTLKKQL